MTSAAPRSAPDDAASGFTSLSALGTWPTTGAALEGFTAAVQDLCAGRSTAYREGDRVRDIRFLHSGAHVNTTYPIEFVVAAVPARPRRQAAHATSPDLDPYADSYLVTSSSRCWTSPPTRPPSPRRCADSSTGMAPLPPPPRRTGTPRSNPNDLGRWPSPAPRGDFTRITDLEQAVVNEVLIQPVIDPPRPGKIAWFTSAASPRST